MPSFMLPEDQGHLVTLELLAKEPAALSFHRGHWCPYCRINTNALAHVQCEFELIAIVGHRARFAHLQEIVNPMSASVH
jgi:peroxiredoxin